MGQVVFHTGLDNKLDYLVRLVRKASRQGAKLFVLCENPLELSKDLWRISSVDFVAHATADADPATVANSNVLLSSSLQLVGLETRRDVLINAGKVWPAEHAGFARIIELVGVLPDDVAAGRERWKRYVMDGVEPAKLG
jgi:DNA polymerase-3 subunit chi